MSYQSSFDVHWHRFSGAMNIALSEDIPTISVETAVLHVSPKSPIWCSAALSAGNYEGHSIFYTQTFHLLSCQGVCQGDQPKSQNYIKLVYRLINILKKKKNHPYINFPDREYYSTGYRKFFFWPTSSLCVITIAYLAYSIFQSWFSSCGDRK